MGLKAEELKRYDAYPKLIELLRSMCKNARMHDAPATATEINAVSFLHLLGEWEVSTQPQSVLNK